MRIALCNEVIADRAFAAQCTFAAALGYDGLEVAPFTLGDDPPALPQHVRAGTRRAATDAGIAITGLHWLLVKPEGLSITSA
jgi:D-psicose/D-tagatose/L-ribulose 3-epimerase